MAENETPSTEGDAEWRRRMQETNELAKELQPPHDAEAERGQPTPSEE
jgi:hypothetical protein